MDCRAKRRVNNEISHWRVLIADFYLLLRVSKEIPGSYKKLVHNQKLKFCAHMGQFPQDGENGQNVAFFYFFSSAVTKRFDFLTFLNCSEEILPVAF